MARATPSSRNQSVRRAAVLLRILGDANEGLSTVEVAQRAGLTRQSTSRLLLTLAEEGLAARRIDTDRWVPGLELERIGRVADPYRGLTHLAHAAVGRLARATNESAALVVSRDPRSYEIVLQVDPDGRERLGEWVGRDFPMHASPTGKIILGDMDEGDARELLAERPLERRTPATIVDPELLLHEAKAARERGYAEVVEEMNEGEAAIGVPVSAVWHGSRIAVGIAGPVTSLDADARVQALGPLRRCAAEIAELIAET